MELNYIIEISKIVAVLFTGFSFLFGIYIYMINSKKERVKSTLEYWEKFYQEIIPFITAFNTQYSGKLHAKEIREMDNLPDTKNTLHNILNKYEQLAIGIDLKAYEIKALNLLSGHEITSSFHRYEGYIFHRRIQKNNPQIWSQFEELTKNLIKLRNSNNF
ncbi:hypothetical protein CWB76_17165 [Pseudoalteromonas sp. S1609]|uniref:DUF4760 domain-containing protein n=1 Tax=Pseudoalteromonas sp. S1609 TaxID=579505 RepID=UPI00110B06CB|nr:DUF4760 domain-containing protein [Pseudoalteromonas sp. S1609]TMP67238.1 hypothetical protein CWB76_17165 [Pseudoalteromonas sp. S1609]